MDEWTDFIKYVLVSSWEIFPISFIPDVVYEEIGSLLILLIPTIITIFFHEVLELQK